MRPLQLLVCLGLVCVEASASVDPRGTRPLEPGTGSDKCATQKEWPFCTDDDWGHKCPSGCRIQGLMDKYDHGLMKKVEKIRRILDENRVKHRSTDQVSKQTYDYLKDKLTTDLGHDTSYHNLAQGLRQRITEMKVKIDRQLRLLGALKDRVKDQVVEMQRLEVDIDIKLRSCKGSCSSYSEHQVDKEGYVELDKQINQLDSSSPQSIQSVGTLYVMKSRLMKDVIVDSIYKSGGGPLRAAQHKEDVFKDVENIQLILEAEGSPASPATITKDQVCMRLKQQKQDGRQPVRRTQRNRRRWCRAESDVPLCSDDDWVSKCPSGCRLQGLISQMQREVERKLWKVCKRAKLYEDAADASMTAMTQIYNSNRRVIVNRYISELKFVDDAEELTRTLTSLRRRSSSLSQRLKELQGAVRKQVADLYRTEVDIDMKLRACHGSCRSALPFTVDHPSYQTLETDMDQVNKAVHQRNRAATPPEDTAHVWIKTVDMSPAPSVEYRSIPEVQRELLTQFEDIGQNELGLEELLDSEDVEVLEHF